ncbi:MAG: sigma-54-dependent Fis family transcriptional regulator [Deltaproteobacteria bacterium]|nr:sigma-54-dependent Fis family transcriptional regulator [Deltaproteobacteria bacterium]
MSFNDSSAIPVLIADDDSDALQTLKTLLENRGMAVVTAGSGQDAWHLAQKCNPSLILLDINMPKLSGYDVLRKLKAHEELKYIPVIFLTARNEIEEISAGLNLGANDYITKPYRIDELISRINAFIRLRSLYLELKTAHQETGKLVEELARPYRINQIVAKSPQMHVVCDKIKIVANSSCPVLIIGESGVGKELVARALHYESPRRDKRFIAKNCAAFQETLLEAELFGYVKGAFTGALEDRVGLFHEADKGTLFLDEIAEMPPTLQAKLLRVLQDGSFIPIGSTKEEVRDVRIVAATNKDILPLIETKQFREDLYYRINVVTLDIPPLRQRPDDIMNLAQFFLLSLCQKQGLPEKRFAPSVEPALRSYQWRGNVRELKNTIERLLIFFPDQTLVELEHLNQVLPLNSPNPPVAAKGLTLHEGLATVEKSIIENCLNDCNWNKSQAAKSLGISRSNLLAKIATYSLQPRFK